MAELDLTPLDDGLAKLLEITSGPRLAGSFLREGEALARAWQGRVQSAGLIRTGRYESSIRATTARVGPGSARVLVGTDLGYPNVLEYGDRVLRARPVAHEAYEADAEAILGALVDDMAAAFEE